ncbi:MAG: hypothetical protein IKA62_01670 [Clostridia bacterium]|nr:hypothetical protein [Clostridia bacterium]
MAKKIEMPLSHAREHIGNFFGGDVELIEAFYAICDHIIGLNPDLVVRCQREIIGVARIGEYYRFYVSLDEGKFYIKYKNIGVKEELIPSEIEKYKELNVACCEYFDENRDHLISRTHYNRVERMRIKEKNNGYEVPRFLSPEDLEKWKKIHEKGIKALECATVYLDDEEFECIYGSFFNIILDAISDLAIVDQRDRDIILNRILYPHRLTLQELGDWYGVSRECIRRRERSAWQKMQRRIISSRRTWNPSYRIRIADLLVDIRDEAVASTVERVFARNNALGQLMQSYYGF